jgi:hypothetical protein
VRPHPLVEDSDVPRDAKGRRFCRCGVVEIEGDPRHVAPDVPEQAEHRHRYDHDEED